jgi:hypothetical protein
LTYIDQLAQAIRAKVAPEYLPEEETTNLFRIYAVLALAKGEAVEAADVHDAWSAWMSEVDSGHRSIKPMAELSSETQAFDEPFAEAIRVVARERGLRR